MTRYLGMLLIVPGISGCTLEDWQDTGDAGAETAEVATTEEVTTDELEGVDNDGDGVVDGYYDPIANIGTTIYFHESVVQWTEGAYVVGFGFTGEYDWEDLIRLSERVVDNYGDVWYRFTYVDYGSVYRVTITRTGTAGPDDFTNWAWLTGEARYDPLWWGNPDGSGVVCFTVRADTEIVGHNGTTCDFTYGSEYDDLRDADGLELMWLVYGFEPGQETYSPDDSSRPDYGGREVTVDLVIDM